MSEVVCGYVMNTYRWSGGLTPSLYRGADKSLARPGRKQATATKL